MQMTSMKLKKNLTAPFFSQLFKTEHMIKKTAQMIVNTSYGTKGEYMMAAPVATACKPK